MDFWAQHKDFVLRVLAGVGVFLVALIVRGMVYGDDLENEVVRNSRLKAEITSLKLADPAQVTALKSDAGKLARNAAAILDQIGWNTGTADLERVLLRRILGYTRTYRGGEPAAVEAAVQQAEAALLGDVNAGFGQLRLKVRDDLLEEAGQRNIEVVEGIGFEGVTEMEAGELRRYLMQLELTARFLREAIEARLDTVSAIRIWTDAGKGTMAGVNPDFLQEHFVEFEFRGSESAVTTVLNRMAEDRDGDRRVPPREVVLTRNERPADTLQGKVVFAIVACNPSVPFQMAQEAK